MQRKVVYGKLFFNIDKALLFPDLLYDKLKDWTAPGCYTVPEDITENCVDRQNE